MLIIFNLSGLIVGLIGLGLGLAAFMASGKLALGLVAIAVTWIGLGLWWKFGKPAPPGGERRKYPALFFIPLPFLAIPLVPLAFLVGIAEVMVRAMPVDPRAPGLQADEQVLTTTRIGGDSAASEAVMGALDAVAPDGYHVLTRIKPDAVLVLVKAPDLKHVEEPGRARMLDALAAALEADPRTRGRRQYLGIKGRFAFGAVRVPPGRTEIAPLANRTPLLAFYGEPTAPAAPVPVADKPPAPSPATTPDPEPGAVRPPEAAPATSPKGPDAPGRASPADDPGPAPADRAAPGANLSPGAGRASRRAGWRLSEEANASGLTTKAQRRGKIRRF